MKSGRSRRGPRGTPPPTKHPTSSLRPRLCRGKIPRKPAQNRSHPATKRQQFRKTEARCAGAVLYRAVPVRSTGPGHPPAPRTALPALPLLVCPLPRCAVRRFSVRATTATAASKKKKQRRASTSTPGQGSQPTQTTKRTRPEQQSIGARALPPELLRLTVTPRVPPPPPRPPPAASRRHLRSASLGSDPSRHVRPPLLLTPER